MKFWGYYPNNLLPIPFNEIHLHIPNFHHQHETISKNSWKYAYCNFLFFINFLGEKIVVKKVGSTENVKLERDRMSWHSSVVFPLSTIARWDVRMRLVNGMTTGAIRCNVATSYRTSSRIFSNLNPRWMTLFLVLVNYFNLTWVIYELLIQLLVFSFWGFSKQIRNLKYRHNNAWVS